MIREKAATLKFKSLFHGTVAPLFCLCALITTTSFAAATSVWEVLRSQLSLNHSVTQPEVQSQLRWLISHPSYLQNLARSEPYMYHIVTEIKKHGMPGEIALLPMIESAYDPFAYSGAGAAGLWQLMPGTGTNLGLKQDWWFDGRRSIRPSTDAALNYLRYLNRYFHGDWVLAIAAYDSGEGTVSRAIKSSGQTSRNINFWTLPVPGETKAYVPRLLALAEIIKYPQRYGVTLPDIPHVPYFEEVNIGSQIDLSHAAKLAGISYKDLLKLNPGYNRWTTAPYKPFNLLIPTARVAHFNRNLANVAQDKRVSWIRHKVLEGDTITGIAQHYFTSPGLIRELNQLKSDKLKTSKYILIPGAENSSAITRHIPQIKADTSPSTERYKVIHIVQVNENIEHIEKIYNVSKAEIKKWNTLSANRVLHSGEQLIIWKRLVHPGVYTVKPGDSLGSIAVKNHSSVSCLKRLNPNIKGSLLKPGQKLAIG